MSWAEPALVRLPRGDRIVLTRVSSGSEILEANRELVNRKNRTLALSFHDTVS